MSAMQAADLERVYESLAISIDRAGRDHEALFLAKLVLLLANDVGQFDRVQRYMDDALADMSAAHQETEKNG